MLSIYTVVGNKLPVKSILFCKMTLFIITEAGYIDKFDGGKMDAIYQADDQYFDFFEEQIRELQAKKSQGIIRSVFLVLTGSRHKTRRQVASIPPIPETMGTATPVTATEDQATPMPPLAIEAVPEATMPAPVTVIPMQPPIAESQLGGSYINNLQVHDSSNISVCSSDMDTQENLKSHFNDRLGDKIYTTFRELFNSVNINSLYEKLPKINEIIGK